MQKLNFYKKNLMETLQKLNIRAWMKFLVNHRHFELRNLINFSRLINLGNKGTKLLSIFDRMMVFA